MKYLLRVGILICMLSTVLLFIPHPTLAATDFMNVVFTGGGTCYNFLAIWSAKVNWSVSSPPVIETEVDTVNGSPHTATLNTGATGMGYFSSGLSTLSTYSAKQPYTLSVRQIFTEGGTVIGAVSGSFVCSGGILTPSTEAGAASNSPGPAIPSGFVLRTITCNTPVYTTVGGIPVTSGEHITNGQTWFVSPTPAKDAKDREWTEIFDGGWIDGFIPTDCVGDKPVGYKGL